MSKRHLRSIALASLSLLVFAGLEFGDSNARGSSYFGPGSPGVPSTGVPGGPGILPLDPEPEYESPVLDFTEPEAEPEIFFGYRLGQRRGNPFASPRGPAGGGAAPGGGFGGPGGGGPGPRGGGPKKNRGGSADLSWASWWQENRDDYLGSLLSEITTGMETKNTDTFMGDRKATEDDELRLNRRIAREKVYPRLINLLHDDRAVIRAGAVLALGKSGDANNLTLVKMRLADKDTLVRQSACMALAFLETQTQVPLLIGILENRSAEAKLMGRGKGILFRTRAIAALSLGVIAEREDSSPALKALMNRNARKKSSREIRLATIVALGLSGSHEAVTPLVGLLRDESQPADQRSRAALALGRLGSRIAVSALSEAVQAKDKTVARAAAIALGHVSKPTDGKSLRVLKGAAKRSADLGLSLRSTIALGRMGGVEARNALLRQLGAKTSERSAFAALGLGIYARGCKKPAEVSEVGREILKAYQSLRSSPRRGAFAIALGLGGCTDSIPYLRKQLSSRGPLRYRIDVSTALALLGDVDSVGLARDLVLTKAAMPLRIEAMKTMVAYDAHDTEEWLKELTNSPKRNYKIAALYGLGMLGKLSASETLANAIGKKRAPDLLRQAATYGLGSLADYRPRPIWSSLTDRGLAAVKGGASAQFFGSL